MCGAIVVLLSIKKRGFAVEVEELEDAERNRFIGFVEE